MHKTNRSQKKWRAKNHPHGWKRAVREKKLTKMRKKDPSNPTIKVLEKLI